MHMMKLQEVPPQLGISRGRAQRCLTELPLRARSPVTAGENGPKRELRRTTERLSLAIRAGGVGTWEYDVVHDELVWDDQMFRLYGISREQSGGTYAAWQSGLHPDDRLRGDEEIRLALTGDREFDTEFRVCWPNGTVRHLRAIATVERDAAGHAVSLIGTNWDITGEKRNEEALRASAETYRDQFVSNTSVMLMVDPSDGAIIDANRAAVDYYGYPLDQFLSMRIGQLNTLPESDLRRAMATISRKRGGQFEFRHRLADGSLRDVEVSASLIQFGSRKVLHSIIHDVTARRRAEEALRESEASLRRLFDTMSELIVVGTRDGRNLFARIVENPPPETSRCPQGVPSHPSGLLTPSVAPASGDMAILRLCEA